MNVNALNELVQWQSKIDGFQCKCGLKHIQPYAHIDITQWQIVLKYINTNRFFLSSSQKFMFIVFMEYSGLNSI